MGNRKAKRWSGMTLVLVFMALILMAMVSLSSPTVDRTTQTLSWVIEKLK
jgi:Tfp pilus assembly protein PilX